MERRADRSVLGLAVPAAVLQLLAEQTFDDGGDVQAEVGAERHGAAVDARLDLAVEEPLPRVLPAAVVAHRRHGAAYPVVRRVDAERVQEMQRWQRRGPGLSLAPPPASPIGREARAPRPLTVRILERE
ncbi:MAG: hypothetical protein R2712_08675 [Vicinamibacterales bacterium]